MNTEEIKKPQFTAYDEYVELAARTECDYLERTDKAGVKHPGPLPVLQGDRSMIAVLHQLLAGQRNLGRQQDLFKKLVVYGKPGSINDFGSTGVDLTQPTIYALKDHQTIRNAAERLAEPEIMRLLHASIGMATEAAELQEHLFSVIFDGAKLDVVNVQEEIGDASWYHAIGLIAVQARLATETEDHHLEPVPPVDALRRNIHKLAVRYGDKFSELRALTRDLDAERKVLETQVVATDTGKVAVVAATPTDDTKADGGASLSIGEKLRQGRISEEKLGVVESEMANGQASEAEATDARDLDRDNAATPEPEGVVVLDGKYQMPATEAASSSEAAIDNSASAAVQSGEGRDPMYSTKAAPEMMTGWGPAKITEGKPMVNPSVAKIPLEGKPSITSFGNSEGVKRVNAE